MAQRPGIPKPDPNLAHSLTSVLGPVKENIDIWNGLADWQRAGVTLGMLVQLQIITEQQARALVRNQ